MNYPIESSTYQHYKGNYYQVFFVAKQTETQEQLVIYQCLATKVIYARPLDEFMGEVNGVPRFKLVFNALYRNEYVDSTIRLNKILDLYDTLQKEKNVSDGVKNLIKDTYID